MITRENKIIRLSWAKADLFQTICTETAYNARTLADAQGRLTLPDKNRAFLQKEADTLITFLRP